MEVDNILSLSLYIQVSEYQIEWDTKHKQENHTLLCQYLENIKHRWIRKYRIIQSELPDMNEAIKQKIIETLI